MTSDERVKILIVEDELIISDNLKNQIEKKDSFCVVAQTVRYKDSVDAVRRFYPDLVLIDIKLRGEKTGLDLGEFILSHFPEIPFIYITSFIDEATIEKAKQTFPAGYLSKPFNFDTVKTTIEIALFNRQKFNKTDFVCFNDGKRYVRLETSTIRYIKAANVYIEIALNEHTEIIRSTLKKIIKDLPSGLFFQVNRSTVVNSKFITEINGFDIHICKQVFTVSHHYYEVLEKIKTSLF